MSLKRPTPRRALKDRKTVTTRPIPVEKKKRILDQKTVWEMKMKKRNAERKVAERKVGDATFEITEENFRQLIKETIVGVFKEFGIIPSETSEEQIVPAVEPKVELEAVEEEIIEPKEEIVEEEIDLEGDEPEEEPEDEEEKIEDDDFLAKVLGDPNKKKQLLELLKDGKLPEKKAKDAAAVFVNTYDRYSNTPTQPSIETETNPSGYNRYAINK